MAEKQRVVALGFFDGVHRGHGALLQTARALADETGAVAAAVTFDHHPRDLIQGSPVPLLNTLQDKEQIMKTYYNMDEMIALPFTQEMRQMPWQQFVTQVLHEELGVIHVVAGHDHHFGYKGEGDVDKLRDMCAQLGIGCHIVGRVEHRDITVSSTYIRSLIQEGKMERAVDFLGHPHMFTGTVVPGNQLGRTIGTPTANLHIPQGILVPPYGVYATKVQVGEKWYPAVTNVGVRPTVNKPSQVTIEPWILDFQGDLYGQTITVAYYARLRGERKFDSMEDLKEEILRNAQQTRDYFGGLGQ